MLPYNKENLKNQSGAALTQLMFLEERPAGTEETLSTFTLKDDHYTKNGKTYWSLYKFYMEEGDPTEYEFATKFLVSWEQWQRLCRSKWFKPYVTRWRQELELKIRAKALRTIMDEANNESSKTRFTSNKFLLEKGWLDKSTKGRPTKDQIKKEMERQAELEKQLEEDMDRISSSSLNVVKLRTQNG